MASRHQVREVRRHGGTEARSEAAFRRRGFSLIEVLLSVFILSIGVISITALFPAGILQQRQSVDDITGPIVAQNALAILRTKLRPGDFGFGSGYTVDGDFAWSRPAFFTSETNVNGFLVPSGSIDIFNEVEAQTITEVLYVDPSATPPHIIFTQSERYYPMASIETGVIPPKPQYVWDCMFRRFQGKVMVAIFVYRTTIAGGGDVAYNVPPNGPPFDPNEPPIPWSLDVTAPEAWTGEGAWDADGDQFIIGTTGGTAYDSAVQRQSWQEPGQWNLDQNNNLHRVLSQTRKSEGDPVMVELVRPVPSLPVLAPPSPGCPNGSGGVYFYDCSVPPQDLGMQNVVANIWYIPREVTLDGVAVRLTPVYVTVREL